MGKTLYVTDRNEWRSWLVENHDKEKAIWLVYYRKASGKPRIPYNDAVEEALCYGWIDSTVKGMDEERFVQRFTPRRSTSVLSEMNRERIRRLIKGKKMTSFGLRAVSHVFDKDDDDELVISPDIVEALKGNERAWENFRKFSDGYKRVRIGYIEGQRKHGDEMFGKSLRNFIMKSARNEKFGMVR